MTDRTPTSDPVAAHTLTEMERADPFMPHDLGCRCYPHVSQRAAIEAATQAATAEYREARQQARAAFAAQVVALRDKAMEFTLEPAGFWDALDAVLALLAASPEPASPGSGLDVHVDRMTVSLMRAWPSGYAGSVYRSRVVAMLAEYDRLAAARPDGAEADAS